MVRLSLLTLLLSLLALGTGIFAVREALKAASARARAEAVRAARATALAVRQILERPEVPDLFPETRRFTLGPKGLQVPAGLGWYLAPPPPPPPSWKESLLLERVGEFRGGRSSKDEALRLLKEFRSDLPREKLAAAWLAQALEERKKALGILEEGGLLGKGGRKPRGNGNSPGKRRAPKSPGAETPPGNPRRENLLLLDPERRISLLLLLARLGVSPPGWAEDLFFLLPEARGRALAARLVDLVPVSRKRFRIWMEILDRAAALRRLLRKIHPLLARLVRARAPLVLPLGKEVLVFHPSPDGGGKGVLAERKDLLDRIRAAADPARKEKDLPRLPSLVWSGRPWFGTAPPEGAALLWEEAWIVPEIPLSGGLESWLPWALLPLLGLPLLLGLLLSLRAARREWEAFRARADFLTSVTHQLKTPLSSIRLFAEMLREGKVSSPEKNRLYLDLVAAEAGRLSSMVENVLDLKRLERGDRVLDPRPLELGEFLRRILELLRPLAEQEGLALEADLPRARVPVRADPEALHQVLFNLFENVRAFAREGGLFRLELVRRENGQVLRVLDKGPGIPPSEREALFEPFRRGRRDRGGTIRGVGLGLTLSRRILRAHGGDLVCVDPPPGYGACFELVFPPQGEEGGAVAEGGRPGREA